MIDWNNVEQKIKHVTINYDFFRDNKEYAKEFLERYTRQFVREFTILAGKVSIHGKVDRQKEELEDPVFLLTTYLFTVENTFVQCVDQLIFFILIKTQSFIWDSFSNKFVNRYDELKHISLYMKVKFLEKYGFDFLDEIYDRKLRNSIAHSEFDISGNFIDVNGKKYGINDIENLMMNIFKLKHIIIEKLGSDFLDYCYTLLEITPGPRG